ncbi:MAG: DNA repair protein RadA [Candidatus Eremiobacteraeota bacterium]|nr:DNA repair protein RadA [Candidatus Eremiobacteraeota bacterium]
MPKARTVYFCSGCGFESTRWLGRCPSCQTWNSFSQAPAQSGSPRAARSPGAMHSLQTGPVRLCDISDHDTRRISSGMLEFDALLGGGIVPGSLTLLGGPPGAGKSTLLLQIAEYLGRHYATTVYVCGEESAAQIKLRATRLGIAEEVLVFPETNLQVVLEQLERVAPKALIVDSIQTVWLPEAESYAGSVSQVRDCAQALMEFAKRTNCATFLVGHVTKDGAIAGPRLLEHLVDTVLYFEGDNNGEYRIVRSHKNRFGSADEICVFSMHSDGLHEVANPSQLFVSGDGAKPSGSCVVACIVGSRPILVEMQALVGETTYGSPRRLAANIDQARLAMVIAVLERRAGMQLGAYDVYASVAGGLRVNEPAADLGIALAIASAFRNVPLGAGSIAFGELGLSGEVRAVSAGARRMAEARKLGYSTVYGPHNVRDVAEAVNRALAR